jgi:hypothetical protein
MLATIQIGLDRIAEVEQYIFGSYGQDLALQVRM